VTGIGRLADCRVVVRSSGRSSAKEAAMDPDRFDAVARLLAPTRSRRAALGLAAGAVAALGLGGSLPVDARKKKKKKKKCKADKDCKSGQICAKGKCVTGQGTCAAGADTCAGVGNPFCFDASGKHECICLTRLEGGTRCGVYGNGSGCDQCETDADCLSLGFPPGSSCTQDFGPECGVCQNNNKGSCVLPCGVKDPTPA
jgi:hypothetical protein